MTPSSLLVICAFVVAFPTALAGPGLMKARQKYNGTYTLEVEVCLPYLRVARVGPTSPVRSEVPAAVMYDVIIDYRNYFHGYYFDDLILQNAYLLKDLRDVDPCNDVPSPGVSFNGSVLLMALGNCSAEHYFNYTKVSEGSGLVLVVNKSYNVNGTRGLELFSLVFNSSLESLKTLNTSQEIDAEFLEPEESKIHFSSLLLWVIAVICVGVGSFSGPYRNAASSHEVLEDSAPRHDPNMVKINVIAIILMVVFISTTLLLLYFFYKYLVYFFISIFGIASARAVYDLTSQLLHCDRYNDQVPRIRSIGLHQILLALLCLSLPIVWFVFRHNAFAWILQDILGACFCIHLIQTLKLPSLKVCTILLVLLFIYDIFFVFITPFFTADGVSIMVEVATGGGSGESLPLLFKMPQLEKTVVSGCFDVQYSVLGFGDIIIPAFAVCYVHSRDILNGDRLKPYFLSSMIGYGVGLAIAFVVVTITQTGQPALLYLVPTTLIPIYAVALYKKEVKQLWTGSE